jgi:cytidyltransferase-like protein
MTDKTSKDQSTIMTNDLILALEDYYNLPPDNTLYLSQAKNVRKIELLIKKQNASLGIEVDTSRKEDIIEKAANMSIEPIEGIVYNYGEKKFKFTGSYAPLNQLMGFNTAYQYPSKFPRLFGKKIDWDIREDTNSVAIFPGSFKPPHIGHKKLIEHYLNKGVDQLLVVVSNPSNPNSIRRIGSKMIDAKSAVNLWKILAGDLEAGGRVSFIVSPVASPIEIVNCLIVNGANRFNPDTEVHLCVSRKGTGATSKEGVEENDSSRFEYMLSNENIDPNIQIHDPITHACPPMTHPEEYIVKCQELNIFDRLPSQESDKDSRQYHASDLRFLLNEVSNNPEIKQLLKYFLDNESIIEKYLEFIL